VDGLVTVGANFIPGLAEVKDRAEAARTALKFIADGGFEKPWLMIYDNVPQASMPPSASRSSTRRRTAPRRRS